MHSMHKTFMWCILLQMPKKTKSRFQRPKKTQVSVEWKVLEHHYAIVCNPTIRKSVIPTGNITPSVVALSGLGHFDASQHGTHVAPGKTRQFGRADSVWHVSKVVGWLLHDTSGALAHFDEVRRILNESFWKEFVTTWWIASADMLVWPFRGTYRWLCSVPRQSCKPCFEEPIEKFNSYFGRNSYPPRKWDWLRSYAALQIS